MGDINPTLFLSPAKPSAFIRAVGPTFTLPTATDRLLGAGKYGLGPAAVALTMQGPWVIGALINNQWSVAGWGHHDMNQTLTCATLTPTLSLSEGEKAVSIPSSPRSGSG